MPRLPARFAALTLAATLASPFASLAQTAPLAAAAPAASVATNDFAAQVLGIAPQLVAFAGSPANFQNLVNGLAQGLPIVLVGATADGFQQTATFTPTGSLTAVQVAQILEQARQALIVRGVAAPTPEQIGIALLGGRLPTPAGTSSIAGILGAPATPSASTGASTTPAATSLQVDIRPLSPALATGTTPGALPPPATTSASPQVRNTSDTPFTRNTSDTPVPPTNVPSAAAPGVAPSGSVTNTSPAAQMQGRR